MAQHRSSRSPARSLDEPLGTAWDEPEAAEITDIIPFNEFGDLADLDFRENPAFDRESQVIHAPELDDLHDTDDLTPLRLAVPSEFRPDPRDDVTPRTRTATATPTPATAWPPPTSSTSPAGAVCTASRTCPSRAG